TWLRACWLAEAERALSQCLRRKRLFLHAVLTTLQPTDPPSTSWGSLPVSWLLVSPCDLTLTLFSSPLQKAVGLKVWARVEPHHNKVFPVDHHGAHNKIKYPA
ncbi:mCG1042646, partial [Mus musculus]